MARIRRSICNHPFDNDVKVRSLCVSLRKGENVVRAMALAEEVAARVNKFHRKLSEARSAPPGAASPAPPGPPKPRSKLSDVELAPPRENSTSAKPRNQQPVRKHEGLSSDGDRKRKDAPPLAQQPVPPPVQKPGGHLKRNPWESAPSRAPKKDLGNAAKKPPTPAATAGSKKQGGAEGAVTNVKPAAHKKYELPLRTKVSSLKMNDDEEEEAVGWWTEVPPLPEVRGLPLRSLSQHGFSCSGLHLHLSSHGQSPPVASQEVAAAQILKAEKAYNAAVAKHEARTIPWHLLYLFVVKPFSSPFSVSFLKQKIPRVQLKRFG